jgi:hypothetical protein
MRVRGAVEAATQRRIRLRTIGRGSRKPGIWSYPGLISVCVLLPVIEVAVLWGLGMTSTLGIAPSVTAPAPFATFHDLRWLMVYHRSWIGLAGETIALLAFRGGLTAALVWLAWPRGAPKPPVNALVRNSALFTLASIVLMAPWVGLLFGLAVMPISWLFFAAVPPVLFVGLLIHAGAVRNGWQFPIGRTTAWIAASFLVLTLSGGVLTASPAWLRLPLAAASGLFNAWAWSAIVSALALRTSPRRRMIPVVPLALVVMLVLVAAGAGYGFRANVGNASAATPAPRVPAFSNGRPVLLVSGLGGRWDGIPRRWLPGNLEVRRYSYAGEDRAGHPLPYASSDTHLPLPNLVAKMGAQVDALHRQSGRPVAIVAESEGALVAKAYMAVTPGAPVDQLVMLSPLVQPARVYFPASGEQGWGLAGGWELREIGLVFRDVSGANLSPDMPVIRSVLNHGPAIRDLLACPLPRTRQLAMFPLADAVATPHPSKIGIRSAVIPAFHGGLLADQKVRDMVSGYLLTGDVSSGPFWPVASKVLRASAAAWQVPELPLTLNPAWSGPSGRSPSCQAMASSLTEWLR